MKRRMTKDEIERRLLLKKQRRELSESQYNTCMIALGYTYDEDLDKYFLGNNAFLMNVSEDVIEVGDLMMINKEGQLTYGAKAIFDFINIWGAELTIGDGAINEYCKKYKKGLFCTNYRELFSDKNKIKSKKIED